MALLAKKLRRELWNMKVRSTLIVLSIALSIAFYGGLFLVKDNVLSSLDKTYEELHYEDFALRTYAPINESQLQNVQGIASNIAEIDHRLTLKGTVELQDEEFSARIHGISQIPLPVINQFKLEKGSSLSEDSPNEILVELGFAKKQDLQIGDKITLIYGGNARKYKVRGIVFSPEYKYGTNPDTGFPEIGTLGAFWLPIDQVRTFLGNQSLVNEVFFRVKDKALLEDTAHEVQSAFSALGVETILTLGTEEPDHEVMSEDVGFLDDYAFALGGITALIAIFIIYDSLSKLVFSQKQIIGVLRAMGGTKRRIIIHYTMYGLILSLLGAVIGIPLGFLLSIFLRNFYISIVNLPFVAAKFQAGPFIEATLLALVFSVIGSGLASYKIGKINPAQAMTGFEKGKPMHIPTSVDKAIERLSRKHKITNKIPVRQVIGRKKRSTLTILTIVLSSLIVITSLGFTDSIFTQIDIYYDEYYQYNLEAYLATPISPITGANVISQISGIKDVEPIIRQAITVQADQKNESTFLTGYLQNSSLRHFGIKEGKLEEGEVLIGKRIASELDLSIGDTITIIGRGFGESQFIKKTARISGILAELIDLEVFTTLTTAQNIFDLKDNVTGYAIKTNGDIKQIKKDLRDSQLPITSIFNLDQSRKSFETLMQGIVGVNFMVMFIGFIILVLFSINTITLDILERDREIINLRVNGATRSVIGKMIILQVSILALFAMILEFPVGRFATEWVNEQVISGFMTVKTYISPKSYAATIAVLIAGLGVGVYQAIRNAIRISLVLATRIRFQT